MCLHISQAVPAGVGYPAVFRRGIWQTMKSHKVSEGALLRLKRKESMKKNTVTKMLAVAVTIAMPSADLQPAVLRRRNPLPVPLRQQEKPHRQKLKRETAGGCDRNR